jgi:hypothetical protein
MAVLKLLWSYIIYSFKKKEPPEYEHPSRKKVKEILKNYKPKF